ncbi:MAG: hypothetical protein U5K31_10360 [Balneolaceae bacterium]|nr:hypothetical protein [Balneolaceae bacterium]
MKPWQFKGIRGPALVVGLLLLVAGFLFAHPSSGFQTLEKVHPDIYANRPGDTITLLVKKLNAVPDESGFRFDFHLQTPPAGRQGGPVACSFPREC